MANSTTGSSLMVLSALDCAQILIGSLSVSGVANAGEPCHEVLKRREEKESRAEEI